MLVFSFDFIFKKINIFALIFSLIFFSPNFDCNQNPMLRVELAVGAADTIKAADVSAATIEAATRPSTVSSWKLGARGVVDTKDPLRSNPLGSAGAATASCAAGGTAGVEECDAAPPTVLSAFLGVYTFSPT